MGNALRLRNAARTHCPILCYSYTHLALPSVTSPAMVNKKQNARALTFGSARLPLAGASSLYHVVRGGQPLSFQKLVHSWRSTRPAKKVLSLFFQKITLDCHFVCSVSCVLCCVEDFLLTCACNINSTAFDRLKGKL